jgi:hypothetical protein
MKRSELALGLICICIFVLGAGVVLGRSDATVRAWGYNFDGQCDVPPPNADFVAVAAGYRHSLGLKSDGSISAWGDNGMLQCDVPAPNADFVAVAAGHEHSLGVKSDGSVVAWGPNFYGELDVPAPNTGFVAVAAGYEHSLGLKSDSTFVGWGNNSFGQQDLPGPNADFVAVAAGMYHSLGLKSDSTIVASGYNTSGQCNVPPPNAGFVAVAAGDEHSLGLKSDGTIVAWGENFHGQCNVTAPNADFVAVAAGYVHSLGLKSDGSVVAWGYNFRGQCNVPAPNDYFVAIAGGGEHSLGVRLASATLPMIQSVTDVGNDQGGQVRITWDRSWYDAADDGVVITGYGIYRRQDQYLTTSQGNELPGGGGDPGSGGGPGKRAPQLAGWDYLETVPARGDDVYQVIAPTLCDSTASSGMCWSEFFVSAMTPDPLTYFDSPPDTGYSVDNLAPTQPQGLAGEQVVSPEGLTLSWLSNTESDLECYAVYRGLSSDFTPSPLNRIGTPTETALFDAEWRWDVDYCYKVSAMDIHGNESIHALLEPDDVTAIGELTVPHATYLSQNLPNPFNPSTTIPFSLPMRMKANLSVYNVEGRLVTTLVDDTLDAGFKVITWHGEDARGNSVKSGVYFYRLTAGDRTLTKKMVLLK